MTKNPFIKTTMKVLFGVTLFYVGGVVFNTFSPLLGLAIMVAYPFYLVSKLFSPKG